VAVALALGGALVRLDELFPLALAAVVLVGCSLLWVRTRAWRVDGRRAVSPARVRQGDAAHVDLSLTNRGRRRSPVLAARDSFDGGERFARFAVSPLPPGGVVAARYRLPTEQRGLFWVGPMELSLHDPFGLAEVTRKAAGRSPLSVYPAFDALAPLPLLSANSDGDELTAPQLAQQGEEFYALREYQNGDDLRRVHWTSSARADRLMIRENQQRASRRLLLVGDLRSGTHTPASLERALSALASLADAAIRGSHAVRLVSTGGTDSRWGEGSAHFLAILDLLAAADTHPARDATSLRRCIWDHARSTSTVVVTSDAVDGAELTLPGDEDRRQDGSAVVVIERLDEAASSRPSSPWPAVVVPVGVTFAAAWEMLIAP
jgi:uncharacterized protein (DUF58 family)